MMAIELEMDERLIVRGAADWDQGGGSRSGEGG